MDKTKGNLDNLKDKLEDMLKKSNECCIIVVIIAEILFMIFLLSVF